jgi:parallel beta-helix repeat protein
MKKGIVITIIIFSFLLTHISVSSSLDGSFERQDASNANGDIIYVDDDNTQGPWNGTLEFPYQYIHDAVENASNGDTIYVFNGTYNETVTVDKTLQINGENKNNTIIDGMYNNVIVRILRDSVSIMNFTVRNSGGYLNNAGIKLDSKNNLITKCIFYRTKSGVYVNETNNNDIINCTFYTNGEGIYLRKTIGSIIKDCCFTRNAIGLNLQSSYDCILDGCYAHTNGIGFFVNDSSNIEIVRCAAFDNNDNQGGLFISMCKDININNCNISHNGFGLRIINCSSIYTSNSNFYWNTHNAIKIAANSEDICLENCEIAKNFRFGVYSSHSESRLLNNNFYSSIVGLYSDSSICNARNNWWGSALGPSFFEHKTRDKIMRKHGRIKYFPWRLLRVQNAGTNWEVDHDFCDIEINNSRFEEIELPGNDSDSDKVPDWWEEKWGYDPYTWDDHKNLDPDNDALNNIEECYTDEYDSNPYHKDIFIEFDWIEELPGNPSNKPRRDYIEQMIEVFDNNNITLHMDDGSLGGGEEIPYISNFSYIDVRDIYWNYFLHNDLNNPRKGIFHYCLICDYGPHGGFSFVGWYHLDSFEISAQSIKNNHPSVERDWIIIEVTFHELGHTLGLFVDDHGGVDNKIATMPNTLQFWKYRNYKSCMHYLYTYKILDYSDGSHGKRDFDDWSNLDFTFFKNSHFEWPKE